MSWHSYWPHNAGAESVCRVAGLRWFLQLVGDILQILADRPQDIRADVAAQDDLTLRRDAIKAGQRRDHVPCCLKAPGCPSRQQVGPQGVQLGLVVEADVEPLAHLTSGRMTNL